VISPQAETLEAMFYDWHNAHRLVRQRQDVTYWLDQLNGKVSVMVLGAGTGRVASPIAGAGHRVIAVDLSLARLRRVRRSDSLLVVCADMRKLPLVGMADAAIVPYSAIQLLQGEADRIDALTSIAYALRPGGFLAIDTSESVDRHETSDWRLVLRSFCNDLHAQVEEWERATHDESSLVLERSYRIGAASLLEITERWAHLAALDLTRLLETTGFRLDRIDRGYGNGDMSHRHIYHAYLRPMRGR
jgi:SAM-dependent methyltransferase